MSTASRFFELYRGREEFFAEGYKTTDADGEIRVAYRPVERPLTIEDLERHLAGQVVVGVYHLRRDSTVLFASDDLDDEEHPDMTLARARKLRRTAAEMGFPNEAMLVSFSGRKGHHVDFFFAAPIPAATARLFLQAINERAGFYEGKVEIFPKQDRIAPDEVDAQGRRQLGNLIKLPLGIHPLTGKLAELIEPQPVRPATPDVVMAVLGAHEPSANGQTPGRLTQLFGDHEPGFRVKKGERHDYWTWRASRLRNAGLAGDDIFAVLQREAREQFEDYNATAADEDHLRQIVNWFAAKPIGEAMVKDYMRAQQQEFDDQGFADLLGDQAPGDQAEQGSKAEPKPTEKPLVEEAFYGLAGQVVRAIEPHSEADPAALLLQFLVMFGNVIGRSPHFYVEADRHACNLFAAVVGDTAKGRKGTSFGRIRRLYGDVAPEYRYRIDSGLSSGEGLIWAVRDPIMKIKNGEEEMVDPGISDKRFLAYEPELASVFTNMAREKNILSAVLRKAWDDGDLHTLTKNSPASATGAHISMAGHITKDELLRVISRTEAANGFGNRFMWVCSRRSKLLPRGGGNPDLAELKRRLEVAISTAAATGEVDMDAAAWTIWDTVYGPLSAGKPGLLGAMLGRAEAIVRRLAMIYALLDLSQVVQQQHLLAALAVWDYCEASAKSIFGDTLGDPAADEILRALRNNSGGLTRNQLIDFFSRHIKSADLSRALGLLVQQRLARVVKEETGGRPAERFFAEAAG